MTVIHGKTYTVGLLSATRGWFEHNELGDECGGGLWFEDDTLIDYDGVYMLSNEVLRILEAKGIDVEEMKRVNEA